MSLGAGGGRASALTASCWERRPRLGRVVPKGPGEAWSPGLVTGGSEASASSADPPGPPGPPKCPPPIPPGVRRGAKLGRSSRPGTPNFRVDCPLTPFWLSAGGAHGVSVVPGVMYGGGVIPSVSMVVGVNIPCGHGARCVRGAWCYMLCVGVAQCAPGMWWGMIPSVSMLPGVSVFPNVCLVLYTVGACVIPVVFLVLGVHLVLGVICGGDIIPGVGMVAGVTYGVCMVPSLSVVPGVIYGSTWVPVWACHTRCYILCVHGASCALVGCVHSIRRPVNSKQVPC